LVLRVNLSVLKAGQAKCHIAFLFWKAIQHIFKIYVIKKTSPMLPSRRSFL